jgi:hypothetical protein
LIDFSLSKVGDNCTGTPELQARAVAGLALPEGAALDLKN